MGGPGGNSGGDMNRQQPGRLIIPGQEGAGQNTRPGGGGLVIPGGNNMSGVTGTAPSTQGAEFRNFRPPPGFMDAGGVKDTLPDIPQQEMLNRLQAQAGHWHELAKLLPSLQAKGIDAFAVEEATGLERKTQNLWTSSASIYDALKNSGLVKDDIMAYYDVPGAEILLHELRFLSLKQRAAAVAYIAENALDDAACTILARAMKEHERRNGRRDGFSDSPQDSLAYKYYRDALECRDQEEAAKCAKKGLALVQTEDGRAKLKAIDASDGEVVQQRGTSSEAVLSVLRLERDEVGCRPIALAGALETVTAEKVRSAPKVSSEGPFAAFTVPTEGATWPWVPLPAWSILSLAGRPVAFDVANCASLPCLRSSARVRSDDDLRKLQGPGVMIIDISPSAREAALDPAAYYMVALESGGVELLDGATITDAESVLGPVLFLCRPPARDTTGSTTAELLSL